MKTAQVIITNEKRKTKIVYITPMLDFRFLAKCEIQPINYNLSKKIKKKTKTKMKNKIN